MESPMVTKLPSDTYLPFWERAKAEEIGIEITCVPEDQLKLVNALYQARSDHSVDEYEEMMIFQPKPEGRIFIAHKTVELPE